MSAIKLAQAKTATWIRLRRVAPRCGRLRWSRSDAVANGSHSRLEHVVWRIAIAASLLLASCGDANTITAGPIRLSYPPNQTICRGTATHLADVAARQATFLGLPLPSSIGYHYDPQLASLPCAASDGAAGCYDSNRNEIWTKLPDLVHELVHAIVVP